MINILDYNMLDVEEYVSETAIVLNKHRDYEVLKGIKWYFIELPKFRIAKIDMNDKLNQWLAFIDDYDKEMVEMAEVKNKTLQRARKEMTYLTGDAAVQRLEELREKWEMDRVSSINFEINQRNKQIAQKLKQQKMSIEEISKITELTKEEIESI